MSNLCTVIIPTTGSDDLFYAIDSVIKQTTQTTCYVVCDGDENKEKTQNILSKFQNQNIKSCFLPINVGRNNYYGHRVYAAFTHLVDTPYISYLDQDNWFDLDHVESNIQFIEENNLDWCYSLRKIYNKNREYLFEDNCESLGKWPAWTKNHLIDTNSYCIPTKIAIQLASSWHGQWGQDRVIHSRLDRYFPNYECTGKYTSNYKLAGNANSVNEDFFIQGNNIMNERYKGEFPWKRN